MRSESTYWWAIKRFMLPRCNTRNTRKDGWKQRALPRPSQPDCWKHINAINSKHQYQTTEFSSVHHWGHYLKVERTSLHHQLVLHRRAPRRESEWQSQELSKIQGPVGKISQKAQHQDFWSWWHHGAGLFLFSWYWYISLNRRNNKWSSVLRDS